MHYGLDFDVSGDANYGYWLDNTWTNGQNDPDIPIYGFQVTGSGGGGGGGKITIQNASGVTTQPQMMQLMVLEPGEDMPLEDSAPTSSTTIRNGTSGG